MSVSGLQVISYKLSVVMSTVAAVSVASMTYIWSDDVKQLTYQLIDMPSATIDATEPHDVVRSSEPGAHASESANPSPAGYQAPKMTRVHTSAKRQHRLIAILKGPPREAILQSEGGECIYRLGDRVPGWGVIIAITDRSVLSMKEQLALMNDAAGPSHELRHASSAEPCSLFP